MRAKQIGICILTGMLLVASVAGCGKKNDDASATSQEASAGTSEAIDEEAMRIAEGHSADTDIVDDATGIEEMVKLPDYKGIELTKTITNVTDEAAKAYAESLKELVEVTDPEAELANGDVANIAYVGEKDGVAFEGGTSESYDLEIGSGTFIPGFEDGCIGMKVGETRDLDLTFPEEYGNEELNGAAVVFHVTLNAIKKHGEASVDEIAQAKEELQKNYDEQAESELQGQAWSQVKQDAQITGLRNIDLAREVSNADRTLRAQLEANGMTFEDYLEMNSFTQKQYEDDLFSYANEMAKERVLIEALAKAEGISQDDEEYDVEAEELATLYGMSLDELIDEAGEDYVYQYVMTKRLSERIVSYAKITTEEVDAES